MSVYSFSEKSKDKLSTCSEALQQILNNSIKITPVDFAVTCGHRNEADQNRAFENGYSKLKYPDSEHNKIPSCAVDIVPYINNRPAWDEKYFYIIAGVILSEATRLGTGLIWGGFWKRFRDLPHFQLDKSAEEKKTITEEN